MKTKVTEQGVVIPKDWLEGVDEVELRREDGAIIIVPVTAPDPIFDLGQNPILLDVDDASIHHDHYLYGP